MPIVSRIAVLGLAALAFATGAAAQTYKWTDKDGRVQYSDRPPPAGAKSDTVQPRIGSVSAPASSGAAQANAQQQGAAAAAKGPQTYAEKDQAFRKRQMEQEEARQKQAKADQDAKQRSDACNNAKSRLAGLEAGGRQVRFDEKGERVFLEDAQIDAEKSRARNDVSQYCR